MPQGIVSVVDIEEDERASSPIQSPSSVGLLEGPTKGPFLTKAAGGHTCRR